MPLQRFDVIQRQQSVRLAARGLLQRPARQRNSTLASEPSAAICGVNCMQKAASSATLRGDSYLVKAKDVCVSLMCYLCTHATRTVHSVVCFCERLTKHESLSNVLFWRGPVFCHGQSVCRLAPAEQLHPCRMIRSSLTLGAEV